MWRPLAPAVTHDSSNEYFSHGPENSRYMLFNFQVINKSIPAVTHFDHSSRVQHVQNPDELIHRIMTKLKESGRPPVLLNTSFNGPGVPIVETAMDAFEEANKLNINFIITDFGVFGKK
jgi:carbamoyltransferase